MKVTFEFDTDSEIFDKYELEAHYRATDMAYILNEITEKIRSWVKWDEREAIPKDLIFETIWDIIQDNGISMEKLGY